MQPAMATHRAGDTYAYLRSHLKKPRGSGDKFTACCPAHDDKNPSLSVKLADDRVLLHCHSHQCSVESIASAAGVEIADLFDGSTATGTVRKFQPKTSLADKIAVAENPLLSDIAKALGATPIQAKEWYDQKRDAGKTDAEIIATLEGLAESHGQLEGVNSLNSLNSHSDRERKKPVLSSDALYGLAGDAIRAIEPYTEASVPAMLIQLLACFGVMIDRGAWCTFGRSRQYLKVNTVLVGPSGIGRKGTSWDEVAAFLERVYGGFREIVVSGLSSGEGLIHHVRDAVYKKVPLKEKGKIVGYQDEMVDEGVLDKRRIVKEPEFSRPLKAAGREGSILSEVIRDAYDTDVLRVMTKNELKATYVHIAFIGHITEFELKRELDDTAKANGFGNRINWIWTERSKALPLGGEIPPAALNDVILDFADAYEFARNVGEMSRTADADELWCEVYEALGNGYTGMMEAITSRATTHVMRLACIYALLDRSTVIDYPHLKAALAMWQYSEDSARYIFGNAVGDRVSDSILSALEEAPEGLDKTQISNVLGRHAKSDTINASLDRLEALGRVVRNKVPTSGAPRTIFSLTQDAK